jgi:pSer/pThr/pTyr-binding forkhead associated (FHA) protein
LQPRVLFLLLAFFPTWALAQTKVTLDFGSKGDRDVWISDRILAPASTLKSTDATLDLPVQGGKGDKLFVWDRKSGNLALKPVEELKTGWKLTEADFKLVGRVQIRVEHEGQPVAVAFVTMKDGAGERESQIDPDKNGTVEFYGVRPGNVDVTVRYNIQGKDAEPVKQSFVLNAKRSQPDPTFVVSLTDEVATATTSGSTAKSNSAPSKEEKPASGGSVIGNILVYLLGLGAAGALIYFGLQYMKKNQDKVKDQLLKVGVQIPDPHDPAQQDPGPVPVPIAPAPPQKIILDDADPNVPAAHVAMAPAISEPSLILDNGDVFVLPEGETSVGRDTSNGLALAGESTVSRHHAVCIRSGSSVTVRDLGSSNGTFVNGVQVASDTALKPGDQVQFGQARVRFEA